MEQHLISLELGNRFDSWSSEIGHVELADDYKRAIIEIPLMHYGPNKKGLFWTKEMLQEVTPMFQGVTFRYDLNGQEGSSHTIEKLSSPHFDVGWTYSGEDGAWYEPEEKTLWVKGEVTHPQVVEKLQRATTDGKREVNYASMGVVVEEAICSICGSEYGTCEHERLKDYDGHLCYKVPTKCSKGLHVALTNDPADGEADIKSCVFQEFGVDNMEDKKKDNKNPFAKKDETNTEDKKVSVNPFEKKNTDNQSVSPNDTTQANKSFNPKPFQSQIPGGLAPSSPQTAQLGTAPSSETILRDLAERIKTIEQKIAEKAMQEPTPEVINSAPQDQMMQDGMATDMGNTEQFGQEDKMDVKAGQVSNASAPLNPAAKKAEMQELPMQAAPVDPMMEVKQLLQQILAAVSQGKAETQDVNSLINTNKGQFKNADENMATEHLGEGAVGASEDEGNKKNKENMLDGSKVAIADMQSKMDKLLARLEIADNEVPEFGGSSAKASVEIADMGADARAKKFGDYGKYDAIFNGAKSAQRFVK